LDPRGFLVCYSRVKAGGDETGEAGIPEGQGIKVFCSADSCRSVDQIFTAIPVAARGSRIRSFPLRSFEHISIREKLFLGFFMSLRIIMATFVACFSFAKASPQDKTAAWAEAWRAYSETAVTITGNVHVSASGIVFQNGRRLAWQDLGPVANFVVDPDGPVNVELFKVTASSEPVLERGNTICTPEHKVTYIATWIAPKMGGDPSDHNLRAMAAFYGDTPPTDEMNSHVCSSFYYEAPKGAPASATAIDFTAENLIKRQSGLSMHVYQGY
jgi:hypothetical protein